MPKTVVAIISCYNSRDYIHSTIESILRQTHPVADIVCVDDGCTDETPAILQSYGPPIRLIRHPGGVNKGCAASLNLAVASTNSDYIAFLDHDDNWLPEKTSQQFHVLESNPHIALVYANGFAISPSGTRIYRLLPNSHRENNDAGQLLLNCYIKSCSAVMVSRDALTAHGPFDERLISMDHDMWLRIAERHPIAYLPEPLYEHRIHPRQTSQRRKLWEDGFTILEKAVRRHSYGNLLKFRRTAVLHYRLGMHDYAEGHALSGIGRLVLAGLHDPPRAISEVLARLRNAITKLGSRARGR